LAAFFAEPNASDKENLAKLIILGVAKQLMMTDAIAIIMELIAPNRKARE
jgi:hypothetical protein